MTKLDMHKFIENSFIRNNCKIDDIFAIFKLRPMTQVILRPFSPQMPMLQCFEWQVSDLCIIYFIAMLPKLKKLVFEVQFQQSQSPYQGRSADTFLIKFNQLRQMLLANLQEFVPVDVLPRQPPPHLIIASGRVNRNVYLDPRKNKLVEFPRKNSFEIYVDSFQLFSRLETGNWPDVKAICEWALRVAEKIVDLQIEKQQAPLKEQFQMMGKDAVVSSIPSIANQTLPPVTVPRGFHQTISNRPEKTQLSNYYPRSRYSSLIEEDTVLPYGLDPMNTTSTQRKQFFRGTDRTKGKAKSIDKELKTISRDFYGGQKQASFHWNLKQKPNKPIFSGRFHEALVNSIQAKTPINVQLSPLPAVHHNKPMLEQIQQVSSHVKNEMVELRLSDSTLNLYSKFYRIDGIKVSKILKDQIWGPILCETPLPLIGEYSFQLTVFHSLQNQIQLGIAPLNYYPRAEPQKADILVSFNCGTGQIKDAKLNSFASETQWREGGVKITQSAPFCLRATVNTKAKIIQWYVNDIIAASAKLPSQYNFGFRAFISLYRTRDTVVLNQSTLNSITFSERQIIMLNSPAQAGAQVGINTAEITNVLPITQNRIFPKIKHREALYMAMIDQSIQTAPFFEGRIKKQRLHNFFEKQTEKVTQNSKEEFSLDGLKTYKTIQDKQTAYNNLARKANPNQCQKQQPVSSQIHAVIYERQLIEKTKENSNKVEEKSIISHEQTSLIQLQQKEIDEKQAVRQKVNGLIKISPVPVSSEEHLSASPLIETPIILQSIKEQPINLSETRSPPIITPKQQQKAIKQVQTSLTLPQKTQKKVEKAHSSPIQAHHQVQNQLPQQFSVQQKEIGRKGQVIRWQGNYQDGSFKLKNVTA